MNRSLVRILARLLLACAAVAVVSAGQATSERVYSIGPWVWRIDETGPHWEAPPGAQPVLDVRTLRQQGLRVAAQGEGLFVSSRPLGAGYTRLSADLDAPLAPPVRRALLGRLRVRNASRAVSLSDLLWELVTIHSDPTGARGVKPLMPGRDGRVRLHLGGGRVRQVLVTPETPEWAPVLAGYQEQYRRIRAEARAGRLGDPELHRRVLTVWQDELHVPDPSVFIPADLPKERALPHHTTITDNFNRGDQNPMGSSSEGWSWTSVSGTWQIVSQQGQTDGSGEASARAESSLSSGNHYSQYTLVGGSNVYMGAAVQFASAAATYYACFAKTVTGSDDRISKIVTGARSDLTTNSAHTQAINDVTKCEINGGNLTLSFNGSASLGPFSDSSISGNVRAGMWATSGTSNVDTYSASDIGGGAVTCAQSLALLGVGCR